MSRIIFGQLGRLKPEKIEEYEALHDYFGRGTNDVMKRLRSF